MTIVFDVGTPKQVRFFGPMIARLRAQGCTVRVVSRASPEVDLLRRHLGMRATVLGRYGGATLLGKLVRSSERVRLLAAYLHRVRPDLVVSLSNAESTRAAFGLAIPVVCFMDLPESEALSRLSLPLATRVCAPWLLPDRAFRRYGVSPRQLYRYRALDPVAWLQAYEVRESCLDDLGIDRRRPLLVARETEWQSAYAGADLVHRIVRELTARHADWQVVTIPRYRAHPFYDAPSLLAHADLFLGGGGTMCIEAAYYGTPVIATRLLPSRYMQWLFERGLACPASTVRTAVRHAEAIVATRMTREAQKARARAAATLRRLRFPLDRIVGFLMETADAARKPPR